MLRTGRREGNSLEKKERGGGGVGGVFDSN